LREKRREFGALGECDRVTPYGLETSFDCEILAVVLQETLLAAVRHLPSFRGDASLSTWLYTVARSRCIKHRRRGKFAPATLEPLDAATDATASATGDRPAFQPFSNARYSAAVSAQRGVSRRSMVGSSARLRNVTVRLRAPVRSNSSIARGAVMSLPRARSIRTLRSSPGETPYFAEWAARIFSVIVIGAFFFISYLFLEKE
jgi:hypothetical protein